MPVPAPALERHARSFFAGHECTVTAWAPGPTARLFPASRVLVFGPGPRGLGYAYVSIGASNVRTDVSREFVILAPRTDSSLTETLAMILYYHHTEGLDLGHTFPIGRPWLPEANLDHFLVTLPYPFGPALEECHVGSHDVQFLWLMPVHESEVRFRHKYGLEALESRFDRSVVNCLATSRPPVA